MFWSASTETLGVAQRKGQIIGEDDARKSWDVLEEASLCSHKALRAQRGQGAAATTNGRPKRDTKSVAVAVLRGCGCAVKGHVESEREGLKIRKRSARSRWDTDGVYERRLKDAAGALRLT